MCLAKRIVAEIYAMSVSKGRPNDPCSPKTPEEDNKAREMIVKLNRAEGNTTCADCGESSKLPFLSFRNSSLSIFYNFQILSGHQSISESSSASTVLEFIET